MREVDIPGGKATFKEPGIDEIPGRSVRIIKAAATAMATQMSEYPEVFDEGREVDDGQGGKREETDDERIRRLTPKLGGMKLTMDQALAFDDLREATVVGTIENWTLDRTLPTTMDQLRALPSDLYTALLDAVGGVSAKQLEANFDETKQPKDLAATDIPTGESGS